MLIMNFIFEIIILIVLIFLVFLFIFHNNLIYNDNFFIDIFTYFFIYVFFFFFYKLNKDIDLFIYTSKFLYTDINNSYIKLFLLLQFIFLLILWPKNKLFNNLKMVIKLLSLILFSILGLCLAVSVKDFFLLYICIELSSIPIYILVCSNKYMISIEAGIKYYIFSVISSLFFLMGISFIYGTIGSTLYSNMYLFELYLINLGNYYIFFVFLFILIIFLFKIGLYPFNFWVTNFNEGAALNIVFFISIIPKLPYIYILSIILFDVFNNFIIFQYYIFFLLILPAFITLYISVIEGMAENHFGRFIGQSSMINMSFIYIILFTLIIFHEITYIYIFFLYLIPTLLLFNLISYKDIYVYKKDFFVIQDLFLINNYITIIFYFTLLSLSGLPFFIGFISKWYIFKLLMDYNYLIIVIFLIISGIFVNIFYIRLFFYAFNRIRFTNVLICKDTYIKSFILVFLSFINFFFLFFHEIFLNIIMYISI